MCPIPTQQLLLRQKHEQMSAPGLSTTANVGNNNQSNNTTKVTRSTTPVIGKSLPLSPSSSSTSLKMITIVTKASGHSNNLKATNIAKRSTLTASPLSGITPPPSTPASTPNSVLVHKGQSSSTRPSFVNANSKPDSTLVTSFSPSVIIKKRPNPRTATTIILPCPPKRTGNNRMQNEIEDDDDDDLIILSSEIDDEFENGSGNEARKTNFQSAEEMAKYRHHISTLHRLLPPGGNAISSLASSDSTDGAVLNRACDFIDRLIITKAYLEREKLRMIYYERKNF